MKNSLHLLGALFMSTTILACGDNAHEEGTLRVTVYGEEFAEEGIASDEFEDGWSVTFNKFIVSLKNVNVAGVDFTSQSPIDLAISTNGEGHLVSTRTVPVGNHSDANFVITRVEVSGTATKDSDTKTFDWAFDSPTLYNACETTTSVTTSDTAELEITVHADHFFFDSLVAEEPSLRFQALADADTDGDGKVTREELEATDIGSYDPGSAGGIQNLWDWLEVMSKQLGHVDGEGHCDASDYTN